MFAALYVFKDFLALSLTLHEKFSGISSVAKNEQYFIYTIVSIIIEFLALQSTSLELF
jgi:hypothetical protein